ncbi:hypothetical protein [Sphingomonas nostoxanthinifaciens]|uniref:hypothetical protein n=1 Tax=Sphingomonas nostoxanthinifaciens TaxID=2872652 RepID=UPI001CC2127C|nr:hypothetical protein [Sphingomonas nostoxanthinifaciens]UAK25572.1 hypothetical protein K8P63_05305 [Sphingomonas nostoxanthinifaciens]
MIDGRWPEDLYGAVRLCWQRSADITIAAIGAAAAKWIWGDPITRTPTRLAEFVGKHQLSPRGGEGNRPRLSH